MLKLYTYYNFTSATMIRCSTCVRSMFHIIHLLTYW